MAENLFTVEQGFSDEKINYLSGAGAPAGALATAAPIGSKWSDTINGDTYTKAGAGWLKLASGGDASAIQAEVDLIEAAIGLDADGNYVVKTGTNYLDTATTVEEEIDLLDTQIKTIFDAQALKDAAQDIEIAKKADKTYVDNLFNGVQGWQEAVQSSGAALPATAAVDERFLNFTDGLIYTATAIDTWDTGTAPEDGWAVFDQATDTGYVYTGTAWVQFTGAGQIDAGDGLTKSGNQLSVNAGAGVSIVADNVTVDALAAGGLFLTEDGTTASVDPAAQLAVKIDGTSLTVSAAGLKVAAALTDAIDRIEGVLGNARSETYTTGVSAVQEVDYIPVDACEAVKWLVVVMGTGAEAGRKTIVELLALHDGTAVADAANVDYTKYAKLKVGGNIAGLTIDAVITGAGATQNVSLQVGATGSVSVATVREIVFSGTTLFTTHGEMIVA